MHKSKTRVSDIIISPPWIFHDLHVVYYFCMYVHEMGFLGCQEEDDNLNPNDIS